ncbi:MAG: alpha amylase C-terminal domain-containing protein [Clostridiales bacterium]|nr:alpha amylase C-terminal domain-containing protein [Clostridiales bacterium]
MGYKILEYDNLLKNYYEDDIELRMNEYKKKKKELLKKGETLSDFANGAEYFGFHRTSDGWVYREWAPAADEMYLTGDFNNWNHSSHPMKKKDNGIFEIQLEGKDTLYNGCKVQAIVINGNRIMERIPLYAKYVTQDPKTYLWCAEIYEEEKPFEWTDSDFKAEKTPFIYECHIGMAQEKYGIGTYTEFKENILPRIKDLGYNTIQIMAIMEHPYYGSFGYQVSNFFAASSRYGKPTELKDLVNTAHEMGIRVLLDVVHSHAVKNTNEGINEFDGTDYQFFHGGGKGNHSAWDTKLFNYGKNQVIHFLLSNLKFWMTEYHFDGFRFDGVTSMIYWDHGLGSSFDHYDKYFSMNTDIDALTYLTLANELIHQINKDALTIAEDMSGMPGMCIPIRSGGVGFDYRLAMGTPDMWIKLLKECRDEDWDIWKIWYELTGRRPKEKVIGYAESHDQALVGDKTIMFRLCDKEMYWCMNKDCQNIVIDRGIALHKMIRLITHSLAGEGYLNFMGNEFGHPEWIDFPREGNGWSYHYCRRQWSLVDNHDLKYEWLNNFDKAMLQMSKSENLLSPKNEAHNLWVHQGDKILMYEKGKEVFVMSFHPNRSFSGYFVPVSQPGEYKVILTTDDPNFGGCDRVSQTTVYQTVELPDGRYGFQVYIPSRTAIVFKKISSRRKKADK